MIDGLVKIIIGSWVVAIVGYIVLVATGLLINYPLLLIPLALAIIATVVVLVVRHRKRIKQYKENLQKMGIEPTEPIKEKLGALDIAFMVLVCAAAIGVLSGIICAILLACSIEINPYVPQFLGLGGLVCFVICIPIAKINSNKKKAAPELINKSEAATADDNNYSFNTTVISDCVPEQTARAEIKPITPGVAEQLTISDIPSITIETIDRMQGREFEEFIADFFSKRGYKTAATPLSGDYGIDVILENEFVRIGVQAKRYIDKVTNSAVQEAVAGLKHWNLDKGIVITNNYFQPSAIQLAKDNNITLWDRDRLIEELNK